MVLVAWAHCSLKCFWLNYLAVSYDFWKPFKAFLFSTPVRVTLWRCSLLPVTVSIFIWEWESVVTAEEFWSLGCYSRSPRKPIFWCSASTRTAGLGACWRATAEACITQGIWQCLPTNSWLIYSKLPCLFGNFPLLSPQPVLLFYLETARDIFKRGVAPLHCSWCEPIDCGYFHHFWGLSWTLSCSQLYLCFWWWRK